MKVESNQAIAYAGATGHFILLRIPLKNIKPATRILVIHLPYGNTLQYKNTGNLYLPWITKAATQANVAPGPAHTSLVPINMLCDAGRKVSYDKEND